MKKIENIKEYIHNLDCPHVKAIKNGMIDVREIHEGQTVETWTSDGNLETINTVQGNEYIARKLNEDGAPAIDAFGHFNEWLISRETLDRKYTRVSENVYRPKGGVQIFVQIPEDIVLDVSWGTQSIKAGGVLNITNENDVYGIAEQEFNETYHVV